MEVEEERCHKGGEPMKRGGESVVVGKLKSSEMAMVLVD